MSVYVAEPEAQIREYNEDSTETKSSEVAVVIGTPYVRVVLVTRTDEELGAPGVTVVIET